MDLFSRDKRGGKKFGGGQKSHGDRGGFGGGKKFGGNRGGFGGGGRGGFGGRSEMYQAICSDCGRECEVPFRPTGDKPVLCSSCFKSSGKGDHGFGRQDFDRRERGGRRERDDSFGEKRMYQAICSSCGADCEVPFRPTGDKPVYCSNCFGKDEGGKQKRAEESSKKDFELLNAKLDRIIRVLEAAGFSLKEKPNVEVKAPVVSKKADLVPVKKTEAKKKVAVKKAESKKVVPKVAKKVTKKK